MRGWWGLLPRDVDDLCQHFGERLIGVDFVAGIFTEPRFDGGDKVEHAGRFGGVFAIGVGGAAGEALENDVVGGAEQDDMLELRVKLAHIG